MLSIQFRVRSRQRGTLTAGEAVFVEVAAAMVSYKDDKTVTMSATSSSLSFWPRKPWASKASMATFRFRWWTADRGKSSLKIHSRCSSWDRIICTEWVSKVLFVPSTHGKVSFGLLEVSWQSGKLRTWQSWSLSTFWTGWPSQGDPSASFQIGDCAKVERIDVIIVL